MELNRLKKISFCGNAKDEIISFGEGSRDAGFQLDRVQRGLDPTDWKPMNSVGQGVKEIRFTESKIAHRVIYVAKFEEAVYVLHAFTKKTQKTPKANLEIATKRFKELLKERSSKRKKS